MLTRATAPRSSSRPRSEPPAVGRDEESSSVRPIAGRRDQAWPLRGWAPSSNTPIRRNFS